MPDKCSHDAVVDLSSLDLGEFFQDNITAGVEFMSNAKQTGDYSYLCDRIQTRLTDLRPNLLTGRKDSALLICKALRNATQFVGWGVEHHVLELCDKNNKLLPWVVEILESLDFISQHHEHQEELSAEDVQILYDAASVMRNVEQLTGIEMPLSPRLIPPKDGGEGVHVHMIMHSGRSVSCSDIDYITNRLQTLTDKFGMVLALVRTILLFIICMSIIYGTAYSVNLFVPHKAVDQVMHYTPIIAGIISLYYLRWGIDPWLPNSKRMQATLEDVYKEWLNSPTHGTDKPLDADYTKLTGLYRGTDNKWYAK